MSTYNFILDNLGLGILKPKPFIKPDYDEPTPSKYSYLGTPVFSNLEIPSGNYRDNEGVLIEYEGVRIDTVLLEVTPTKNVVKTAVSGRDGTVKQYISMGDYEIKATGIIVGQSDASNAGFDVSYTNDVPEIEVRKLDAIFKIPEAIEIVSEFLDFYGISTVVIEAASFAQREGFRDSILFNFTLVSDSPIELKQAVRRN